MPYCGMHCLSCASFAALPVCFYIIQCNQLIRSPSPPPPTTRRQGRPRVWDAWGRVPPLHLQRKAPTGLCMAPDGPLVCLLYRRAGACALLHHRSLIGGRGWEEYELPSLPAPLRPPTRPKVNMTA